MGEIADMLLDGTLCERCGTYLDEAVGFPTICAACQRDKRLGRAGVSRAFKGRLRQAGSDPKKIVALFEGTAKALGKGRTAAIISTLFMCVDLAIGFVTDMPWVGIPGALVMAFIAGMAIGSER